jgi:hypothetical protein
MWMSRISKIGIAVLTFVFSLVSLVYIASVLSPKIFGRDSKDCFLVSPYKNINYKVYGKVFEPTLKIPILTTSGYKNVDFLVDSGAVVSTVPKSIADQIFGGDYDSLERTVLRGFGGGESFGYSGRMEIRLSPEKSLEVPVVFSESDSTRAILGRKGFLELITTKLDHNEKYLCIIN